MKIVINRATVRRDSVDVPFEITVPEAQSDVTVMDSFLMSELEMDVTYYYNVWGSCSLVEVELVT